MNNPEKSAEKICDPLFFRGLVEILKIMMENYNEFLKTENNEKLIVNYLIEVFDNSIKYPEELLNLKLNEKFKKITKNMIIEKVEKFINDYIIVKINIIIHRLAKRD